MIQAVKQGLPGSGTKQPVCVHAWPWSEASHPLLPAELQCHLFLLFIHLLTSSVSSYSRSFFFVIVVIHIPSK